MFLLVFFVMATSIVGLFLQVILALDTYLAANQIAFGQQMMTWHAMAYEYACSSTSSPPGNTIVDEMVSGSGAPDPSTATAINALRNNIYKGYAWHSYIFTGSVTANGVTDTERLVATYVLPTETPGGYAQTNIGAQLRNYRNTSNNKFWFGQVNSGTAIIITHDGGNTLSVTYGGVPAAISDKSIIIISSAGC